MLENLIEGIGSAEETAQARVAESRLGRDEFLRMLVAQLENQDPLNPQDGTEFTAQLAQFSALEQLLSIRSGIEELVAKNTEGGADSAAALTGDLLAASLIGKRVFAHGSEFELSARERSATPADAPPEGAAAGRDLPRLSFDLAGHASDVDVVVLGAAGDEVARIEVGRRAQGRIDVPVAQSEEALSRLPAGTYHYRVEARLGEDPVDTIRYVGARVTGTSLAGESPLLLLGDVSIPVSDVIEVRE